MSAINMEFYKVFYYVSRAGSISKAAKELFISQPAVSQSIKVLEENLGGQLFFRTPRGIVLTKEGEVLYKYIEQAYGFIKIAEAKFADMQKLMSGEIAIGASDMSCKYYLLPYLELFHKQFPNVNIKVKNGPTPVTISALKKGLIEFGIISLPVEEEESLEVMECMTIQDCFVGGPKYSELSNRPVSIRELSEYPILLLEPNSNTRRVVDDYILRYGITLKPEIELATSDLLVQFAKRGLGIACVVRNFAEEELKQGNLFEIKLKEEIPCRKLGVVCIKKVPLSAAAKKFIELMHL
jgi:LysR family transcriptional regulator, cyn operon transcriptional activator